MKKQALIAGLLATFAATAFAQEVDRNLMQSPKAVTQPDMDILREAVATVGVTGECNVEYAISVDDRPINIKPNCSDPGYDPFVLRVMEGMTYQHEIFRGEAFESDTLKMPFTFTAEGVAPTNQTAPTVKEDIRPADIARAISRVNQEGSCNVTLTVTTDGKPKDIVPNCTPSKFDSHIASALEKMRYNPGMKDGKVVEWPGVVIPLTLSNPK